MAVKIYICTSGQYEDYSIDAVFTTYEAAKAFRDMFVHSYPSDIEEWEADEFDPEKYKGKSAWMVELHPATPPLVILKHGQRPHKPRISGYNNTLLCYCWAASEEDAVQIAQEMAAEMERIKAGKA